MSTTYLETTITLRLVIYHPLDTGYVLAVTGNHPALGDWHKPRKMALGSERPLLNGGGGRCWEYAFSVTQEQIAEVEYRYLIYNEHTDTAIWEREPNRYLDQTSINDTGQRVREIFDANFVGGMEFDFVPPAIFIGPYPQVPADIDLMKASGVHAVINLQTDEDIRQRGLDWEILLKHYQRLGIDCQRFPIQDFDEDDLVEKLPGAVELLGKLLDTGQRVYIHCTAGMGRSPAVVVAYLSCGRNQELNQALAHVKQHRPVVCPNKNAIRRFLEKSRQQKHSQ